MDISLTLSHVAWHTFLSPQLVAWLLLCHSTTHATAMPACLPVIKPGTISQARGSAYIEVGQTKVVVAWYVQRPCVIIYIRLLWGEGVGTIAPG